MSAAFNLVAKRLSGLSSIMPRGSRFFVVSSAHCHSPKNEPADDAAPEEKVVENDKSCGKRPKAKTPIEDLGEQSLRHRDSEKDPLPPFPDGVNPATGEIGGPRGPEPTRYGDWERKGRVSDF